MIGIREFTESDSESLVEILQLNGQYDYPDIEGPAAMLRVSQCHAAVFLVAEVDGAVKGMARAVYDGSRALIHLLSVHPSAQGHGIGRVLVAAVESELARRGATGTTVTASKKSMVFWEKQGFQRLPVELMLKENW